MSWITDSSVDELSSGNNLVRNLRFHYDYDHVVNRLRTYTRLEVLNAAHILSLHCSGKLHVRAYSRGRKGRCKTECQMRFSFNLTLSRVLATEVFFIEGWILNRRLLILQSPKLRFLGWQLMKILSGKIRNHQINNRLCALRKVRNLWFQWISTKFMKQPFDLCLSMGVLFELRLHLRSATLWIALFDAPIA